MASSARAQIAGDADLAEERASVHASWVPPAANRTRCYCTPRNYWRSAGFGDDGRAVPILAHIADETPGVPALTGYLALACVEGDDLDRAARLLDQFSAVGYVLPQDSAWLSGMVEYAEAAVECRSVQHAGHIFEQLVPFADQLIYNGVTCEGQVSHYLGGLQSVLGHYDEAESHFARSAALCERIDARFFGARTDLLWGRMLAERDGPGDRERGRRLLERPGQWPRPGGTRWCGAAPRGRSAP